VEEDELRKNGKKSWKTIGILINLYYIDFFYYSKKNCKKLIKRKLYYSGAHLDLKDIFLHIYDIFIFLKSLNINLT